MRFIIPFLFISSFATYGQIDSGKYDGNRAVLLLRGGGHFTIREWGGYINGGTRGQYQVISDTLILTDVMDDKRNSVRSTFYLMNKGTLKFFKDSTTNFDYEAKEFKKEFSIPADSKIIPPSLKKYGDFKKVNIPWDFIFYTSASIDGRFMKVDKISFDTNLPPKISTGIREKIKRLEKYGIHNSKDGLAHLLSDFYVIDGFKLKTIESLSSLKDEYVNLTFTYGPDN